MSFDDERPPRVILGNVETTRSISAQFNPTDAREHVAVNFFKLAILGASSKPLQYQNTENHALTFSLRFDALALGGGVVVVDDARRFLLSMCYSRRGASNVSGGAPSRLLVRWPKLFLMTCRLLDVVLTHERYSQKTGELTGFSAALQIDEALGRRLYAEDVLERGTLR